MLLNCGVGNCFGLLKTLESPLNCKEIKAVNPKGNQSWIFIGRTEAKAEAPILWPPDVKNWLIEKDPDARQAPGVGDGHRSLACCSPWGREGSGTTEWLNWNWNWILRSVRWYLIVVLICISLIVMLSILLCAYWPSVCWMTLLITPELTSTALQLLRGKRGPCIPSEWSSQVGEWRDGHLGSWMHRMKQF